MNFSLMSCFVAFAAISFAYAADGDGKCVTDSDCDVSEICCKGLPMRRPGGGGGWNRPTGPRPFGNFRGSFGRPSFGGGDNDGPQAPFRGFGQFGGNRGPQEGGPNFPPPMMKNGKCVSTAAESKCVMCLEEPPKVSSTPSSSDGGSSEDSSDLSAPNWPPKPSMRQNCQVSGLTCDLSTMKCKAPSTTTVAA